MKRVVEDGKKSTERKPSLWCSVCAHLSISMSTRPKASQGGGGGERGILTNLR